MKKNLILLTLLFLVSTLSFAQTDTTTKKRLDCYLSTSLSMSTGNNFKVNSYSGIETGVFAKNMAFGVASGRGNLDFTSKDQIQNYWYEVKAYTYFPIGSVKGYVLGGYGGYFKTSHMFIEYGAGASYNVKKFDFSITVSNWDSVVYITPGICYNFKL